MSQIAPAYPPHMSIQAHEMHPFGMPDLGFPIPQQPVPPVWSQPWDSDFESVRHDQVINDHILGILTGIDEKMEQEGWVKDEILFSCNDQKINKDPNYQDTTISQNVMSLSRLNAWLKTDEARERYKNDYSGSLFESDWTFRGIAQFNVGDECTDGRNPYKAVTVTREGKVNVYNYWYRHCKKEFREGTRCWLVGIRKVNNDFPRNQEYWQYEPVAVRGPGDLRLSRFSNGKRGTPKIFIGTITRVEVFMEVEDAESQEWIATADKVVNPEADKSHIEALCQFPKVEMTLNRV